MVKHALRLSTILTAVATLPVLAQSGVSQLVTVRHASGQGVAPVYEGFDVNPDGSYDMWFGYMNRNYEEAVDLPVGPNNSFEPGGDRGQPTHFTPRRHKDVFSVTVPKDFGNQTLQWTLVAHGQTQKVIGSKKTKPNECSRPKPGLTLSMTDGANGLRADSTDTFFQ